MDTISVFEHQTLKVGERGFTDAHRLALDTFLGNNDETTFPYYTLIHKGVKFRNYVGVLCVNGLTIEVLPKTDRDTQGKDYWRTKLLHMLSKVYKLDVKSPSDANQKVNTNSPILDVFIKRFVDEVNVLINRGLVKCYHKDEGNRKALKGKLLLGEHLRRNFIHKERFYVRYTTYDYEHVMNCLLRQALEVAASVSQNTNIRGRAVSTLFNFPELKEIPISSQLFDNLIFDRKTEDYRMAIKLAKLLLLHSVPNRVGNGDKILALMFDMNKLWEEYVYIMLRHHMMNYDVRAQEIRRFWQQENGTYKTIRPDLVIRDKKDKVVAIMDTKWKCPDKTPSDGDLHQMFVYSKMYSINKVALVYPSTGDVNPVYANFLECDQTTRSSYRDASCDMLFMNMDKDNICIIGNWLESGQKKE